MESENVDPKFALYDEQYKAIFCDERFSIIEASTKSGKTVGCLAWLSNQSTKVGSFGGLLLFFPKP